MSCPNDFELVEARVNKVLTQYRESPKLLHMMRVYMREVEKALQAICDLPKHFQLDSSVDDQLTLLGKRMGWPREHCVCDIQPVFGFECEGVISEIPLTGFCEDGVTWVNCGSYGTANISIDNDEVYRKFLQVRSYQMRALYSIDDLQECVDILFGSTAIVLNAGNGRIIIAPGRQLSDAESSVLQLYQRVMPVAPGINVRWHFGSVNVFGFGEGWGGFCDPIEDQTVMSTSSEEAFGASIVDENDDFIVDENDNEITVGLSVEDAPWMCQIDVKPYDCANDQWQKTTGAYLFTPGDAFDDGFDDGFS